MDDFAKAGASQYTFHWEASTDVKKTIARIRATGMRVGLAIKPASMIDNVVMELAASVDMVLIMTVEPGFGGQTLIPSCLDKVQCLREKYPDLDIQVDGGITLDNLAKVHRAGANIFVAGTLIFSDPNPGGMISQMKDILDNGQRSI